jgi:hypothetical protein
LSGAAGDYESINDFLEGFPAVRREEVIAFLEDAKARVIEAAFFDQTIERDTQASGLDRLVEQALADFRAGHAREL